MKTSIAALIALIIAGTTWAQSPESFKYQAVVRDGAGAILSSQTVGLRMTILQGSSTGAVVYQESFTPTSNAVGLVNLSIGQGSVISGTFSGIDWSAGPYFMESAMDASGGTSYTLMGTSQLLSVPYALHATNVENDSDGQTLTYNGTTGDLSISNGNSVTLPLSASGDDWGTQTASSDATLTGDGTSGAPLSVVGDLTDDQNLNLTSNTLSIDNGNSVDLSGYLDNTDAQTLSFSSTSLSISGGNTVDLASLQDGVNDADADPANELNISMVLSGTTLNLSDVGGTLTADLSSLQDGVTDPDADPTNELQTLSISGQDLTISAGNTVSLPSAGNTLDMAYDQGGAGAGRSITVDDGEVDLSTATTSGIALRTTNTNTGVAILANSTSTANTFSTVQSSTSATSALASAVVGNTDGAAYGVSGQADASSTATAAVYGSNLRTTGGHGVLGIGVNGAVGQTSYSQGYGIYGENFDAVLPIGNGVGVAGKGYWGVVGEDRYLGAVLGAYGVYSNGDFGGSGAKYFVIDHPQDPANKYLRHACIESNEILNMYRGNASFDSNGEATVTLPGYFEEININFSYHLTPVGKYAPLFIKSKIKDGKFVVAGGEAGMEVSWTIYAERNDPYLQNFPDRKTMSYDKEEWNKGKYLRPELYGEKEEKKILKPLAKHNQKELKLKE